MMIFITLTDTISLTNLSAGGTSTIYIPVSGDQIVEQREDYAVGFDAGSGSIPGTEGGTGNSR